MKHLAGILASLALAGCVGDGVEFGGIGSPAVVPANAIACKGSGVKRDGGSLTIPDDVAWFFQMSQQYQAMKTTLIGYDVNEAGKALNVRYIGPPAQLRHATWQKLIRSASDFVQTSTYTWPETPGFATGCEFQLNFVIDWRQGLGD
jgi:hypothetical protein